MNRRGFALTLSATALALVLAPGVAEAAPAAPGTPTRGSTATPSPTATPGTQHQQRMKVTVSNPAHQHAVIQVTVTGLLPGQWIDVDGWPAGWTQERPYHYEVQQTGSGALSVGIEAPVAGWPTDRPYDWSITLPGQQVVTRSTTAPPAATSPKPNTPKPTKTTKDKATKDKGQKDQREKTPKSKSGGLAKTGV